MQNKNVHIALVSDAAKRLSQACRVGVVIVCALAVSLVPRKEKLKKRRSLRGEIMVERGEDDLR